MDVYHNVETVSSQAATHLLNHTRRFQPASRHDDQMIEIRMALERILGYEGYATRSVADGAAAMAVAGFGVGILYPPAAAITLAAAPEAPAAASSRLVLAAGLVLLLATTAPAATTEFCLDGEFDALVTAPVSR